MRPNHQWCEWWVECWKCDWSREGGAHTRETALEIAQNHRNKKEKSDYEETDPDACFCKLVIRLKTLELIFPNEDQQQ